MKRGFIRGLWGVYDNSTRIMQRREKIDGDINKIISNKFGEPFITYIFGQENYERMVEKKLNCVLIDKNPAPFDQQKFVYRHKMELIRYAMENDGYDEIVYMDWDCVPEKKIPIDFWDKLNKREPFQACLQGYRRNKCDWRKQDKNIVPNGGFLYIRDNTYPNKAIECWKNNQQDNDEPAWAKMIDDLNDGWIGCEKYWETYEAMNCRLHRKSPFGKDKIDKKDIYFTHYI